MRTYSKRRGQCELIDSVQDRCRLCLAMLTEKIPIFNEPTNLCASLAVRIMLCVGFEIIPEEGLPKFICTECFKKVNQCSEFKKKCKLVSSKLKSHMSAVKSKETQNTGVTEPKITDSKFEAPGEKTQGIASKLVSFEFKSHISAVKSKETQNAGVTEPKITESKFKAPGEKTHGIASKLVSFELKSHMSPVKSKETQNPGVTEPKITDSKFKAPGEKTQGIASKLVTFELKPHMSAVKSKETHNSGVTEPKITESKFKAPAVKKQGIVSYEDLVSRTLSEIEHQVPVQVNPNFMPHSAVAYTVNTPMNTEEVPLKVQESVIKCLPKKIINEGIPSPEPHPPDMTGFLSSVLLELKVLNKSGDDILLKDSSLRTVEIETGDETVITIDMLQVEEEVPIVTENSNTIGQAKTSSQPMCAHCGKNFASSSALRRHARVHSGERPYVCAVCNRGFAQKEVLVRHELVHMEERPHKCQECPKSFTQRSALDSHMQSHEEPHMRTAPGHSCTKCPKSYVHGSGLSRHMMKHKGRVYECASCSRRFTDQSSLLRHLRVMHRTEKRPQSVIATNPSAILKQGGGVCT